jgi:hypothetical protein
MNIQDQIMKAMSVGRGPNLNPAPPPPAFVLPQGYPQIDFALDQELPPVNELDAKTRSWLRRHPEAVVMVDDTVRRYMKANKSFGFKMIVEVLRWHFDLIDPDGDFNWSNSQTAYLVTIWVHFYPPLKRLVTIKTRRTALQGAIP